MSTVAIDPEQAKKSSLPPGGCPAWDDQFLGWVRDFVRQMNYVSILLDSPEWMVPTSRVVLSRLAEGHSPPRNGPLTEWRLTCHLYKWLNGPSRYPHGLTYFHRLRFMAIQFHYRRDEILAEADRYAESVLADAATLA